jgi:hypothetical protein
MAVTPIIKHVQDTKGHVVSIRLTTAQAAALERLTGRPIRKLQIGVEKLADLANLVAN